MKKPNMSQGNPPPKENVQKALLDFLSIILSGFKPYSRDRKGQIVTSEDLITQDLEKVLNSKARNSKAFFAFQNQHREGLYTTDISVYRTSSYEDFCWIEAKRLPTPNSGSIRDEREYVYVDKTNSKFKGNGGIQRFKEGKHASTLPYSIMIGYFQSDDASYWIEKINGWIIDLVNEFPAFWNVNDCLQKQAPYKLNRCISVHERANDFNKIVLYHFFIDI